MARNAVVSLVIKGRDLSRNALKRAGAGLGKLKASVLSLNTALVAIGVTAALAIGKKLVGAFGKQERAILRVKQSLANAGIFSEELTRKLEKNAAALQRVTQAGDEAILEGTATVADLAKELTGGDFLKVQEAMIGLADTFFNGDVRQASTLLAKTLGSSTNALARYGIEIDTTASQQEKLNQILAITGPMFLTSKAAATDVMGVVAQLSNSLGDLQEAFGGIIVATFGLRDGTDSLREKVDGMTSSIQENEGKWIAWGKFVLATIRAVGNAFLTVTRLIFNQLAAVVDVAIIGLAKSAGFILGILDKIPGVDISASVSLLSDVADQSLEDLASRGEAIVDVGEKAAGAWGNFLRTFSEAVSGVNQATSRQAFTPLTPPGAAGGLEADLRARGVGGFRTEPLLQPTLESVDQLTASLDPACEAVDRLGDCFEHTFDKASLLEGSMLGFGEALGEALTGAIGLGEAFEQGMTAAMAEVANQAAEFFRAKGIAALGEGILFNPAGFAASAKFFLAAGLMGAIGGGGIASGGSGVGGSARGASRDFRSVSSDQGTLTLVLEGSQTVFDHRDPKAVDDLARMMASVSGRRVVIRRTG